MNLRMLNVCAGRGAGEAAALTPPTAAKAETGPCQLPLLPLLLPLPLLPGQSRRLVRHGRSPRTPSRRTAHEPRPAPRLVTRAPGRTYPGEPPTGFARPISRPPTVLVCFVRHSIRPDTAPAHILSWIHSPRPLAVRLQIKLKTAKIDSLSNHFVSHRYNQRNSTIECSLL